MKSILTRTRPTRATSRTARLDRASRPVVESLDYRLMFAAGDLDSTFHNPDGVTSTGIVTSINPFHVPIADLNSDGLPSGLNPTHRANAVAVEPGGKVVTVGTVFTLDPRRNFAEHTQQFLYTRYLLDGTVDTTTFIDFTPVNHLANNTLPPDNYDDWAVDVKIDPVTSTSIIVGTTRDPNGGTYISLAKVSALGGVTLQTRVESAPLPPSIAGYATAMAVQSDGKIVVVGSSGTSDTGDDFSIWRFNANFTLDTTFGTGGVVSRAFESYSADRALDVGIDANGAIYVAGVSDTRTFDQFNGRQKFIVAKLTPEGVLDATFDGDGIVEIADFGSANAAATAVQVQQDGRVVVGGYGAGKGQIVRLLANGTLDPTFGTRGRLSVANIDPQLNIDLNLQTNGALLLTGNSSLHAGEYFVARVNGDGTADTSFNNSFAVANGQAETNPSDADANSVQIKGVAGRGAVQPRDGKILLVGGEGVDFSAIDTYDPNPVSVSAYPSSSLQDLDARFEGDERAPLSTLVALDQTTTNPYTFQIVFTDDVAVNGSSIAGSDFRVTTPSGATITPVLSSVSSGTTLVTATFTVPPPGGTWNVADNGTYTVALTGTVTDNAGNVATRRDLGIFQARISPPAISPPTASLTAVPITTPNGTFYDFTVTYTDNTAVKVSTLGDNDLRITGPGLYDQPATFLSVDINTDGSPRTATYRMAAPNGTFDITDNGVYVVSVNGSAVSDTDPSPNFVQSGQIGQITVAIATVVTGAASLNAPDLTLAGASFYDFRVTYSANTAIDVSTLDNLDIKVQIPGTSPTPTLVTARFVSVDLNTNGTPRTATYRLPATGGVWDSTDSGIYSVIVQASQIADTTTPNPVFLPGGLIGTFNVTIADDTTAPTAALGAVVPVTTAGAATYQFDVTYSDDIAIRTSTLGGTDIVVTGPGFFSTTASVIAIDGQAPQLTTPGTPRVVTYRITAPGGLFDQGDNGTYSISLQQREVSDTALDPNFVAAGVLGTFTVNIPAPTAGSIPQGALLQVPTVTTPVTTLDFFVRFTDDVALNAATLVGNNNAIRVTGPRLFNQVATYVSIDNPTNGTPRTVRYRITAPDGVFDPTDVGTYTVSLIGSSVRDTGGQAGAAASVGTFAVNVPYAVATNGVLSVNGSDFDDNISISVDAGNYRVFVNNILTTVPVSQVTGGISVLGYTGDDYVAFGDIVTTTATVGGGLGNDTIYGTAQNDALSGGQGDDVIRGAAGNDIILGRIGNDDLGGGRGHDYLGGGQGNDLLVGGDGEDTLFGGIGNDNLSGGQGNDSLYARDSQVDTLNGGIGSDTFFYDAGLDILTDGVEAVL